MVSIFSRRKLSVIKLCALKRSPALNWHLTLKSERAHIIFFNNFNQEPIITGLQLPHIPVTAFSQTDLFIA